MEYVQGVMREIADVKPGSLIVCDHRLAIMCRRIGDTFSAVSLSQEWERVATREAGTWVIGNDVDTVYCLDLGSDFIVDTRIGLANSRISHVAELRHVGQLALDGDLYIHHNHYNRRALTNLRTGEIKPIDAVSRACVIDRWRLGLILSGHLEWIYESTRDLYPRVGI